MADVNVILHRGNQEYVDRTPIQDGNLLFNTSDKRIYMDDGSKRYQYGGINIVDEELNADSLNAVSNKAVNGIINTIDINLASNGWSSYAPFTQSVNIDGMTVNGNPIIKLKIGETLNAVADKTAKKNFGFIDYAITEFNKITFYCKYKKPTVDLSVQLEGVY